MDSEGKAVDNCSGYDLGNVAGSFGDFGAGLDGARLRELGELPVHVVGQATLDNSYGNSFSSFLKDNTFDGDMEYEKMDCSNFSPMGSSEFYDVQKVLSTSTSSVFADHTENFNFGPLESGIFEKNTPFLIGDGFADLFMDLSSMPGTVIPPLTNENRSPGREVDMFEYQEGSSGVVGAQPNQERDISFSQALPNPILAADSLTGAATSPTESKPRPRRKTKYPPSLSTQGPRYHCPTVNCTRSYKRQFELIRHQHVHTNIRVHECRFAGCQRNGEGKGFTRKDHMKQHLKLVHGVSA